MIIPPIRNDSRGLGHFGSKRGRRIHKGHDLAVYPESLLRTKSDCIIEDINRAYTDERKKEYLIVSLRIDYQTLLRFFYVEPLVKVGDVLVEDDIFGRVQDIAKKHPRMVNHVHIGLKIEGVYIDPYPWLVENGWLEEVLE